MLLVALGWIYVVLMMSVAEATATNGTLLGAVITFVLYGVLPLSIVLYLMGWPGRRQVRQVRQLREAREGRQAQDVLAGASAGADPDRSSHAAGDAVAPERKEP